MKQLPPRIPDEAFARSKQRSLPYLNLANQVYSLEMLSSEASFVHYKDLELKSLYLRTDKLELGEELAIFLNQLMDKGVREVVIFCDQDKGLSSDAFNKFIQDNKIRINLKMAPLSQEDISAISADVIGKKDLLGFSKIKEHRLVYEDGHRLALLNNDTTDQIISENYAEYKREVAAKHQFVVQEPLYITSSDAESTRRVKDPLKAKQSIVVATEFQMTANIDIATSIATQAEITQDKEQENDLDMDAEQAEHKLNRSQAYNKLFDLYWKVFEETAILGTAYHRSTSWAVSNNIFDSNPKIQYITEKALALIYKNRHLIPHGIDLNNMPIGLAIKDGIIFASMQRPVAMEINEFTIKLHDPLQPSITNPLEYSWLQYATKASIAPNDLYGSTLYGGEIAPKLNGREGQGHPGYLGNNNVLGTLDYPMTLHHVGYSVDHVTQEPLQLRDIPPRLLLEENGKQTTAWWPLKFSLLSKEDRKRLEYIDNELNKRSRAVTKGFFAIIASSPIDRADFLFEEKTAIFLDKLFTEILPLPGDPEKLEFFHQVMEGSRFKNSNLEDVFEGMDGLYKNLQQFLHDQEIQGDHRIQVLNKVKAIAKEEISHSHGIKTITSRLVKFMEHTASMGGSLYEQLEYLETSKHGMLVDPAILAKAKKLGVNVLHVSAELDQGGDIPTVLASAVDKQHNIAVGYLSTIPPYLRASIDAFESYYGTHTGNVEYNLAETLQSGHTERKLLENANGNIATLNVLLQTNKGDKEKIYLESIGVRNKDIDLVTDFTIEQAKENVRLLTLAMISSSGKHYDATYPTQEFESYASVFSMLFDDVKISHDIHSVTQNYLTKEDYNKKIVEINIAKTREDIGEEAKHKQEQHKKRVDNFVNLYRAHPEFNFREIVSLGLVAHHHPELAAEVIKNAKSLGSYGTYFGQLLRVTLANPTTSAKQAAAIARNINSLFIEQGGIPLHQLLTDKGKHPENLVFFAACFAEDVDITIAKVLELHSALGKLDGSLKQELLHSFAHSKLPFEHGKMIPNNFPQISLAIIQDQALLRGVIENSAKIQISYAKQARFNDVSMNMMENSPIDLSSLEEHYHLKLPDSLKNQNYKALKALIIGDKDFVQKKLGANIGDPGLARRIQLDLLNIMLTGITKHEAGWQNILNQTIQLLFDQNKTLQEQFLEIEYNKKSLDALLAKCKDQYAKEQLLLSLQQEPRLPPNQLAKVLVYLNSIDIILLASKHYNINQLVEETGNLVLLEHFDAFKMATDFFIKTSTDISFTELNGFILKLADAKYSKANINKIIAYCVEHKDYQAIDILSTLTARAGNIDKIVDFLTNITPAEIKKIDQNIGIKQLTNLQHIGKITILSEIVLAFGDAISPSQYKLLIKQARPQGGYANIRLLKSYLLVPEIEGISNADRIRIVFDNIATPQDAQILFSENNLERFEHNPERVKGKIAQILRLNIEDFIPIQGGEQKAIYEDFSKILEHARIYSSMDANSVLQKSRELKRQRALSKDSTPEQIKVLDLKFVALSAEMMYRNTGKFPRDTQLLSVLNIVTRQGNIIEEIATGQGKSIITALQASYLSYTGQTVDVVTSDQKLAQGNLAEFTPFYESLGIAISKHTIRTDSEPSEYKKSGINYSVASDLALFRENRESRSLTARVDLKADISVIVDEVDFTLTSEVQYKLAVALISTTQDETRSLLQHVLEFSETAIYKNAAVSKKDDVKNLQLYLEHFFQKYDSSYRYPLSPLQIEALNKSTNPHAAKLLLLNSALNKSHKYQASLFDNLLSTVVAAKSLKEDEDYVILQEHLGDKESLLTVTPVIKHQPSPNTMFSEGVQAFLHLLIEQRKPELLNRFDISLPASTVFNISPKSFLDHYRMTGGRIIGLTGTVGTTAEIEEFRSINKMLALAIPRYHDDTKLVSREEVKNQMAQRERMMEILGNTDPKRPIIIFCQTPEEAKALYGQLNTYRPNVRLADPSNKISQIQETVDNAGEDGSITITTPMLGRGTDFSTNFPAGFLSLSTVTNLTPNELRQIEGRIGRNGQAGTFISLFNKELLGAHSIEEHMMEIARLQKEKRMESQPVADLLQYINIGNQDSIISAIRSNELIQHIWNKLHEVNKRLSTSERKSDAELADALRILVKQEYPERTKDLDEYLKTLDDCTPNTYGEITCNMSTHYVADYSRQDYSQNSPYVITHTNFKALDWSKISRIAHSVPIDKIEIPASHDTDYQIFYNAISQAQMAVMATHAFAIPDHNFAITYDYKYKGKPPIYSSDLTDFYKYIRLHLEDSKHEVRMYLEKGKLFCKLDDKDPLEITNNEEFSFGIPQKLYKKIVSSLERYPLMELSTREEEAIKEFAMQQHYIDVNSIDGEGSSGTLMLDEFKKSFNSYKKLACSDEVNKIGEIIDNFGDLKDVDVEKLSLGQYQAIRITTKVDSEASHAESLLTDGKFLFWLNRGAGVALPGIRVFKITADMDKVQNILTSLKTPKSQEETTKAIFSLLREDDDKTIPKYVQIDMEGQTIGNCGWVQTETMLYAAAMVGRLGETAILPDPKSQKWQKILKDAGDIYNDWMNFDQIQRIEVMLFTNDARFTPRFLDQSEKQAINVKRGFATPISHELLTKTTRTFANAIVQFDDTKYAEYAAHLLGRLNLEVAFDTKMGEALQRIYSKKDAKNLLAYYQNNMLNGLAELEGVYLKFERLGEDKNKIISDKMFKHVLMYIIHNQTSYISLDEVRTALDEVLNPFNLQPPKNHSKNPIANALAIILDDNKTELEIINFLSLPSTHTNNTDHQGADYTISELRPEHELTTLPSLPSIFQTDQINQTPIFLLPPQRITYNFTTPIVKELPINQDNLTSPPDTDTDTEEQTKIDHHLKPVDITLSSVSLNDQVMLMQSLLQGARIALDYELKYFRKKASKEVVEETQAKLQKGYAALNQVVKSFKEQLQEIHEKIEKKRQDLENEINLTNLYSKRAADYDYHNEIKLAMLYEQGAIIDKLLGKANKLGGKLVDLEFDSLFKGQVSADYLAKLQKLAKILASEADLWSLESGETIERINKTLNLSEKQKLLIDKIRSEIMADLEENIYNKNSFGILSYGKKWHEDTPKIIQAAYPHSPDTYSKEGALKHFHSILADAIYEVSPEFTEDNLDDFCEEFQIALQKIEIKKDASEAKCKQACLEAAKGVIKKIKNKELEVALGGPNPQPMPHIVTAEDNVDNQPIVSQAKIDEELSHIPPKQFKLLSDKIESTRISIEGIIQEEVIKELHIDKKEFNDILQSNPDLLTALQSCEIGLLCGSINKQYTNISLDLEQAQKLTHDIMQEPRLIHYPRKYSTTPRN